MTTVSSWAHLPAELKSLNQWCLAGADKAPLSVGPDNKLFNASVTAPSQWLDFNTALRVAQENQNLATTAEKDGVVINKVGLDIGFVIHESDPFCCIDLDVKDAVNCPKDPSKWTTPEQFDRYYKVMQHFDSYTESSRSGKGLHIWVRAQIGKGARRDGVEVYSQERFIICTGLVVLDRPIRETQASITMLVNEMRPAGTSSTDLVEIAEEADDWHILQIAINASNSQKFQTLWRGDWRDLGYPSQSEADLALMSMFTFYSQSNAQCRRLFRESALGKREKAVKDDRYVNFTLSQIRSRQARENAVNLNAIASSAELMIELQRNAEVARLQGATVPNNGHRITTPLHAAAAPAAQPMPMPAAAAVAVNAPVDVRVLEAGDNGLPWPPGLTGAIAKFIYQSAPRPVKEVAIVAALGLLSGICGKAWNIPQSGLNMYIILIARSAIGKEAMHSGISALLKSLASRSGDNFSFVDFSEFASGPALIKACAANPSFVNVSGEWGRKLKAIASEDGRQGSMASLRTVMTNLYQKSGPSAIVGGLIYSNKDSNIQSVNGVAYSMIGETTPGTFYEALTSSMMEDGFLSRFLMVEYIGDRPPMNQQQILEPDKALGDAINDICVQAKSLIGRHLTTPVSRTEDAGRMMWDFEQECDREINSTDDESRRQMWNRASLKVMRLSALLAVADQYLQPCIEVHHVDWAMQLVRRDIAIMAKRLDSGDVGASDDSRERKVVFLMKEYLENEIPKSYRIPDAMRQNSIIPRFYLQQRVSRVSAFLNFRNGVKMALDIAIQSAIDNGYIMEVDKSKMAEAYNYHGKAYRVIRLPNYADQEKKK